MRLQACSLTKDDEPEELRNRYNALEKAYNDLKKEHNALEKEHKAAEKQNKSLREENEFLAEACSFFAVSRRKSAKTRECALLPKRLAAAKRKEKMANCTSPAFLTVMTCQCLPLP